MNPTGYPPFPVHHHTPSLDPAAQEFFPQIPPSPSHIYYPYPYSFTTPQPTYYHVSMMPTSSPPPPPSKTTPSRCILLSLVPPDVSESTIRRELEVFGDVRAVSMERRREGFITVHFYDLRDAEKALAAVQGQHLMNQCRVGMEFRGGGGAPPFRSDGRGLVAGRVVWAQFVAPVTCGIPEGNNQGTLVVFNLDERVSCSYLNDIFASYGPVKELRETPNKKYQRFVEFYDVRHAAKAMSAMNGREIYGQNIVIEYSRPGGQYCKKFMSKGAGNNISNSYYNNSFSSRNNSSSSKTWPRNHEYDQYSKGNPKSGSKSPSSSSESISSIHASVANLSISGGYDECASSAAGSTKKKNTCNNSKKIGHRDYYSLKKQSNSKQPWKGGDGGRSGNVKEADDPRFLINEDAILESNRRDTRTTVMIKNIPNKYSQKLLLNMLDNHCIHCNEQIIAQSDVDDDQHQPSLSSYDFVYLPIDFNNKCNVGYGFVNMTSPEATLRLYKAFHHQNWEVFNSRKICEVTYARLQGVEALREHFKNSKFPGDAEEYMPVVFSPPRDGHTLTDPIPITGNNPPPLSSEDSYSEFDNKQLQSINDADEEMMN